eukprot:scaffold68465_cov18-Tisochrysis_lutea.AAC.2
MAAKNVSCARKVFSVWKAWQGFLCSDTSPLLQGGVAGRASFCLSTCQNLLCSPFLQARSMIVKRAESIGLDWDSAMRERQQQ